VAAGAVTTHEVLNRDGLLLDALDDVIYIVAEVAREIALGCGAMSLSMAS